MGFLVLGDTPGHTAIAETCVRHEWECSIRHSSGRPWVVHEPGPRQPEQAFTAGNRRLALIGAAHVHDETSLVRNLETSRSAEDLMTMRRHWSGDAHVLVSTESGTVQCGTVSRTRRLCTARIQNSVVFSDSAALLAELGRSEIDEELLAAWALAVYPPHPLDDLPLWHGVDSVPPGQSAVLDRDGSSNQHIYWVAPEPEIDDLQEAARTVQEALSQAVEARVHSFSSVSTDLSGGLDSTSLAFQLEEHVTGFETFHSLSDDGLNDDARWAAVAARHLPGAHHHVYQYDASPTWYAPVEDRRYSRDTPDPTARTQAKSLFLHLRSAGPVPHARLNGTGGDELFSMDVLAMHDYLQRDPASAKKPFDEFVYARHEVPRAVRRMMKKDPDRDRSFDEWFISLTTALKAPRRSWSLGWESSPCRPFWATRETMARLGRLFSDDAADHAYLAPISPRKPQHEILKLIRIGGDVTRRMTGLSSGHGVFVESPFLDEGVVDAALRAGPAVHIGQGGYKPLLSAAMDAVLPNELTQRSSKGSYNRELYRGLEENRPALQELFGEDSRAVGLGLANRGSVLEVVAGLPADARIFMELDTAIGVELWLRDIERPRHPQLQKELSTWPTA